MISIRAHAALPAVLVLAGATLSAPAHAQNLVQNGSFEQGTFAANELGGGESLAAGSTVISNWTTTNAEIGWYANGNGYNVSTPYGSYLLDLTGFHDSSPYGGVTQTIATTAGQSYRFSFALGTNQNNPLYQGPVSAAATVGGVTKTFTFAPIFEPIGDQWQNFGFDFVATGSSTTLGIVGTQSGGGDYLGLDNVSVTPNAPAAVPESSTTVSFGLLLTFGGLVVLARRKCAASAA